MFWFGIWYTFLMCALMIGFGLLFLKRPPKHINSIYGYRTKMSSLNQETWDFAHRYVGKVILFSGIVTLIISLAVLVAFRHTGAYDTIVVVLMFVQIIPFVLVIPPTERALHYTFDKDGKRKE